MVQQRTALATAGVTWGPTNAAVHFGMQPKKQVYIYIFIYIYIYMVGCAVLSFGGQSFPPKCSLLEQVTIVTSKGSS